MRLFSLGSFALLPTVGKWSRIATFGSKVKDGAEMTFDVSTLGQMVDNWEHRGMRLPMCLDHESAKAGRAPAAAYFDALALYDAGQLVKLASVADVDAPGGADDKGEPRNGLYARLSQVTPLGADPTAGLANYAQISPYFTEAGAREDGTPVGYELYDVAATNTPFQSGCEIAFERGARRALSFNPGSLHETAPTKTTGAPRAKGAPKMDPKLMQKNGLNEGYSQDDLQSAMAKFAEDADAKDAAMKAMSAAGPKDDPKDDEDKKEMSALAQEVGLSKDAKPGQVLAAIKATRVPLTEVQALSKQVADLQAAEAQRTLSQKQTDAAFLVDEAIAHGRIGKDSREDMIKFALTDRAAAQSFIAKQLATHVGAASVMQRMTANGVPLAPGATGGLGGQTFATIQGVQVPVRGGRLAEKARAFSKANNVSLAKAQLECLKADPSRQGSGS